MRLKLASLAILLASCGTFCEDGTITTATTIGGFDTVTTAEWGYHLDPLSGELEYGPHTVTRQVWNPDKVVNVLRCMR